MTAAAWVLVSALVIVLLFALVMDWWDEHLYRREREQDREALSWLDEADRPRRDDPWQP